MLMSELCFNLSRPQRESLVEILKLYRSLHEKAKLTQLVPQRLECQLPTSINDVRNMLMVGKNSIMCNLPHPTVRLVDNHSFALPSECLYDCINHGLICNNREYKPTERKLSHGLYHCKMAKQLMEKIVVQNTYGKKEHQCVLCMEWSDDFEPSYLVKGNRGSVWIKTITFIHPEENCTFGHTYPVCVGHKGVDHDVVDSIINNDLLSLSIGPKHHYSPKGMKTKIGICAMLLCSLMDQPERRERNGLAGGNSNFHARFGYSCDWKKLAKVIPSCHQCLEVMKKSLQSEKPEINKSCTICTNWAYDINSPLLKYPPPEHYPMELIPDGHTIVPIKLDYQILRCAAVYAIDKLFKQEWSVKNVTAYLKVHCFSSETIDKILNVSFSDETGINPVWQFPELWNRQVSIRSNVETPMHLLFLGIVKTIAQKIDQWLKARDKSTTFIKFMDGKMEFLQKLQLSWCRTVPYKGGKFGGWISENFIALTRIYPWFYAYLPFVAKDPEEPKQYEHKSINNWTGKEMKHWLTVRGIVSNGRNQELRKTIHNMMKDQKSLDIVIHKDWWPVGGKFVMVADVIKALHEMIQHLMTPKTGTVVVERTSVLIQIFLTVFNLWDQRWNYGEGTPTWISSYNFLSLLNLPEQLEYFGPLRNVWEGGIEGESFIRETKPTLNGFCLNWQKNLLTNLYRCKAISNITNTLKLESEKKITQHHPVPGNCYFYTNP